MIAAPVPPGAVIGVLGGGQLGRMLALAAARLGFDVAVFEPEVDSPTARVSAWSVAAPYEDRDAVVAFARRCDVVTYEFENVPLAAAQAVEQAGVTLRPGARALEMSQDRLVEKRFLNERAGVPTARFRPVDGPRDIAPALAAVGGRGVLKTRRLGYDGKGQARVQTGEDPQAVWAAIGGKPALLEAHVAFQKEVSVIAARGADGDTVFFPLAENVHKDGILARTHAPARVSPAVVAAAEGMARRTLDALGYVGVLTIECFLLDGDVLIANEIAPRVHNSGHWTLDAAATDQFEQHVRAVAGWPLADARATWRCDMINLIGADADAWALYAADPEARLHLYGKRQSRPGRKMGHVTRRITPLSDPTP